MVVISGSVDSQTASALTFVFCQLKSFPGYSFHFCQHKSLSVFSLFSLRPETLSKLSKTLRASECDFSEPSRIKVVSSAYWLNLISVSLTNKPFMSAFSGLLLPEFRLKEQKGKGREDNPGGHPCRPKRSCLPSHCS